MSRLHDAGLAGRWYPRQPSELAAEVDRLVEGPAVSGTTALIVPHAGYAYSGRAAGRAYAAVRGAPIERVVVLAPSHYADFRGACTLSPGAYDGFATPLGAVAVDARALRELLQHAAVAAGDAPFAAEHSVEIQLPFLQRVLPGVAVVPLLIGSLDEDVRDAVAGALAAILDRRTLLVISSDFTHYGRRFRYLPFPADDLGRVRRGLQQLDGGAIEAICAGDRQRFTAYVAATGATICGRRPIELFLTLPVARQPGELLLYYTSLDVTGDFEHSVSYAAIRFPSAH
jgi:AmmeMemoRadiSam system protein B